MPKETRKQFKIARVRRELTIPEEVRELADFRKAAFVLNWAAQHYPYVIVPWNQLYQLISGEKKTPRLDNIKVKSLRKAASKIGKVLHEDYGRLHRTSRELAGIRATVDSQDLLDAGVIEQRNSRVLSATKSLVDASSLVDVSKLKANTPERKANKDWFVGQLQPQIKTFKSRAFRTRHLSPARREKAQRLLGKGSSKK
ncbi:MAG: hypothetical protein JSV86_16800 [Gemmatimonadota bacterium]|nr:MAG: hypothetical protein JSV86_16800 [Gemmatimonadota bacterium]